MTDGPQMTDVASAAAPDLSIVSPVYGCVGCLEELVERIKAAVGRMDMRYEILLVDDASPDGAWQRIREITALHPQVRGIRLSRNFGQHAAISAGLSEANGAIVVVMDCDLQDQPEEIPALVSALGGGVSVVLASREDRQDGAFKRLGSRLFYKTLGWLTDSNYDHTTANFGAYSRQVVDVVNSMQEADRFFPLIVRWIGFQSSSIPVVHAKRAEGKSSYSLSGLLRLAAKVVFSFSDKPLRILVKTGVLLSMFALLIVGYSVFQYFNGSATVAGFTSIIASIWLLGGAMIASVGVVGMYVGRIFNQTKARPNFLISEQVP